MSSRRPTRATAKKASYKLKSVVLSDDGMDDMEVTEIADNNDDSDEYVAPTKNGAAEEEEEGDEDEDDMSPIHSQDEEDQGSKKGGATSSKTTRRRKPEARFATTAAELKEILTAGAGSHYDGQEPAPPGSLDTLVKDIQLEPTSLPIKMCTKVGSSPRGARQSQNPLRKKSFHKRGGMHDTDTIPPSWKDSYNGPTALEVQHVSMKEENLEEPVYRNITSNIKDFKVFTDTSDLDDYLPVNARTKISVKDKDLDLETMSATYVKGEGEKSPGDMYMINAGVSVWALDWCPLPTKKDGPEGGMDYVAIAGFPDTAENCRKRDQTYPLGKQDSHPNVIQLWSVRCRSDDDGYMQGDPAIYMSLCILHNYGAVLDMKWCPTGNMLEA
ncbi:hypothetical protein BGZ94_007449, partial [Podila epigama]